MIIHGRQEGEKSRSRCRDAEDQSGGRQNAESACYRKRRLRMAECLLRNGVFPEQQNVQTENSASGGKNQIEDAVTGEQKVPRGKIQNPERDQKVPCGEAPPADPSCRDPFQNGPQQDQEDNGKKQHNFPASRRRELQIAARKIQSGHRSQTE